MQYILFNAPAILVATVAGLMVSAAYAYLTRRRATLQHQPMVTAAVALVSEAWLACILAGALILAPHQAGVWVMSLGSAVIIWIGFVLPTLVVTLSWRGASRPAVLADAALWLAVMLVQAGVLQAVGLHRP